MTSYAKGGGGVQQIMTIYDKGGRGGVANYDYVWWSKMGGGAANFDLMKRGEGEVCVTEK